MNELGDPSIEGSPWREDYAEVERLGTERITREIVVDAKADWVLAGWNSGFSEERGITPALLDKVGIASYLHTETCWDYGDKSVDATPLEALYTDLDNLGKIFGVEKRADELVTELKDRVAALKKTWPAEGDPAKVFVYDSGTDQPFTAGRHAAPNDIITAAGGTNVFDDLDKGWTTVGWEPVIEAKPEVIVIIDYADQPAKDKIAYLKSLPKPEVGTGGEGRPLPRHVLRRRRQRPAQRHGRRGPGPLPALGRAVTVTPARTAPAPSPPLPRAAPAGPRAHHRRDQGPRPAAAVRQRRPRPLRDPEGVRRPRRGPHPAGARDRAAGPDPRRQLQRHLRAGPGDGLPPLRPALPHRRLHHRRRHDARPVGDPRRDGGPDAALEGPATRPGRAGPPGPAAAGRTAGPALDAPVPRRRPLHRLPRVRRPRRPRAPRCAADRGGCRGHGLLQRRTRRGAARARPGRTPAGGPALRQRHLRQRGVQRPRGDHRRDRQLDPVRQRPPRPLRHPALARLPPCHGGRRRPAAGTRRVRRAVHRRRPPRRGLGGRPRPRAARTWSSAPTPDTATPSASSPATTRPSTRRALKPHQITGLTDLALPWSVMEWKRRRYDVRQSAVPPQGTASLAAVTKEDQAS